MNTSLRGFGRFVAMPVTVVAMTITLMAALTGCGSGSNAGAGSPSSTHSASSAPSASTPSPSATKPSATPTPSPSASDTKGGDSNGTGSCSTSQLAASLGQSQGAAGSTYVPIVLTNNGGTCTTQGFPGVSFTAQGRQIGAPAERDGSSPASPITLNHGQSAHATLRIVQAGNFDASTCRPTPTDHLLVYPPDQKDSLTIEVSQYTGCAHGELPILTISPLQAGGAA
ncbi:DUF4232 domain-containing protein [Bifidobacterium mongoliense]|uniref:DUF4232 domain-containing protein n=1 Tax=Bifidobacterium mongoliense TaxID=518643 RepID=UPI0030EC578B